MRVAAPGTSRPPVAWGRVVLAVTAGVFVAFQVGKVIIALPDIRAELDLGLGVGGLLVSSYTIIGAVIGLLGGRLVDAVGHRNALVASLLAVAVGSALGAAGGGLALLLVSRLIEGVGYLGVAVAAPALITRWGGSARTLPLALWSVYLPLGQLVVFVAGPAILDHWGWRGLWLLNAALLVACALACLVVFSPRRAPAVPSPARATGSFRTVLTHPPILLLAAIFGLYSLQYLAVIGFLPTIYAAGHVDDTTAGLLTALVTAACVVGILASMPLFGAGVRPVTLMFVSSAGTAATAVLIYLDPTAVGLSVAGATAFAFLGGMLPSAVFASVPHRAPSLDAVAPANGIVIQASNIGSLAGAPLVGLLAHATGTWSLSPVVLSTCALLALALTLVLARLDATPRRAAVVASR